MLNLIPSGTPLRRIQRIVTWAYQAAQLAELYWMALTRDVPFSKYGEDEATVAAAGKSLWLAYMCLLQLRWYTTDDGTQSLISRCVSCLSSVPRRCPMNSCLKPRAEH